MPSPTRCTKNLSPLLSSTFAEGAAFYGPCAGGIFAPGSMRAVCYDRKASMWNFAAGLILILFLAATTAACTNPVTAITNRAIESHDSSAYNEYLKDAG